MNEHLKIGEKIKTLRKAKDLTQEDLANFLGVSFQAVSKWECGFASPDIALIVPLSRLFGVTIDELFGNEPQKTDERREELQRAIQETYQTGDLEERYKLTKKAVEEYPGDFEFLVKLSQAEYSYTIGFTEFDNEQIPLLESSVKHAEIVIENADGDIKNSALRSVILPLCHLSKYEEALKYAEITGDDFLITMCLSGEEKIKRKQQRWFDIFGELISSLTDYGRNDIALLNIANAIIKTVIPDENYLYYTDELWFNELLRASYFSKQGMLNEAISALKEARKHAIDNDKLYAEGKAMYYTSPMFDRIEFDPKSILHSGTETTYESFTEKLLWDCFDSIRNTDEFKALYNL